MKEAREPLVDKPIGRETLSRFEELREVDFIGENCLPHFIEIRVPVIHGCDTRYGPRSMIEKLFGDMNRHARVFLSEADSVGIPKSTGR